MAEVRACQRCATEDRPQLSGEDCNCKGGVHFGHALDCRAVHRYVVRHLEPLARHQEQLTRQEIAAGWDYLLFQDVHYRLKYLCRGCLTEMDASKRLGKHFKGLQKKAAGTQPLNHYQILTS